MSWKPDHAAWQPPRASLSTRKINNRSNISYRGSLIDTSRNREILYESRLERNVFLVLLASVAHASFREQPPTVWYRGPDGKDAWHTFDAMLVGLDGTRYAIDVKPLSELERSGIEAEQRLIEEQVGAAFADVFVVLTEEHAHPDDVADARLVLRARNMPDAAADEAVGLVVDTLHGWASLDDVVEATGLGAAAFNALARLIGAGRVRVFRDARIEYGTYVKRAEAA